MKDFLDQVTENVTDKDQTQNPFKTQLAQLTQNYSILLKQQNNQQQRQLPKPSRSPQHQPDCTSDLPYAFMNSRFSFPSGASNNTDEFFNLIQNEKNQDDPKQNYSKIELRAQLSLFYDSHSFYNQINDFQGSQQNIQMKKKKNKKCKLDPG